MPSDQDSLSYLSIGSLGTGFGEESLERGLAMGIDFIGADAGSVDGGPSALAGGPPAWSDAAYKRDLSLLLRAARRAGVPLLVGSCALSGRDWGVDYFAEHGPVDRRGARPELHHDEDLLGDPARSWSSSGWPSGRIHPIDPAPPYDAEIAMRAAPASSAVMGVEPFQRALERGADVVLGGSGHRYRHLRRHPAGPRIRPGADLARRQDRRVRHAGRPSPAADSMSSTSRWRRTPSSSSRWPTTCGARPSAWRPTSFTRWPTRSPWSSRAGPPT